jgi:hypothetical protein
MIVAPFPMWPRLISSQTLMLQVPSNHISPLLINSLQILTTPQLCRWIYLLATKPFFTTVDS